MPERLGGDGVHLYVTRAAALAFARATGRQPEEARRRLTELLLDARPGADPSRWRYRSRETGLDIDARVITEGRLDVVTHVHVRRHGRRPPAAHPSRDRDPPAHDVPAFPDTPTPSSET